MVTNFNTQYLEVTKEIIIKSCNINSTANHYVPYVFVSHILNHKLVFLIFFKQLIGYFKP